MHTVTIVKSVWSSKIILPELIRERGLARGRVGMVCETPELCSSVAKARGQSRRLLRESGCFSAPVPGLHVGSAGNSTASIGSVCGGQPRLKKIFSIFSVDIFVCLWNSLNRQIQRRHTSSNHRSVTLQCMKNETDHRWLSNTNDSLSQGYSLYSSRLEV